MSFEIRPTERFWEKFHGLLTLPAQEAVLDVVEAMREHPGDFIERRADPGFPAVMTRPVQFEGEEGGMVVRLLFQYDADEATIHLISIALLADEF